MFLDLRTKEKEIVGRLYESLEIYGFRARILPIEKIKTLHDYSWRNYLSGRIPPRVNKLLDSIFPAKPSKVFGGARSVLLVSAGDSHHKVRFNWVKRSRGLTLPPSLEAYKKTEKDVKEILMRTFGDSGFNFVRAVLPLKIMSSYCAFLHYGTNKVAFVPRRKGTARLFAFYTDLPYEKETPGIYEILEELCSVSPVNGNVSTSESKFTVNETRLLLEGTPLNKFPDLTLQKIISTDLVFNYDKLPKLLWNLLKVKPADFWKIDNYS